ncbi:hypothetical protein [Prosthecobacter sp.]|uniref:hypothetical protein n=1 Tax=Prosthecobacter sp. TaxID=1965333 RepID=UPI003783B693
MDFILRVGIPIYDSLVCFAYSGLGAKLTETFPELTIGEDWFEIGEYSRLEDFLEDQQICADQRKDMLRQLRGKQIAQGPTLQFSMPSSDQGIPTSGTFNRWGVTFKRSLPFTEHDRTRILQFLTSLGHGAVEEYALD